MEWPSPAACLRCGSRCLGVGRRAERGWGDGVAVAAQVRRPAMQRRRRREGRERGMAARMTLQRVREGRRVKGEGAWRWGVIRAALLFGFGVERAGLLVMWRSVQAASMEALASAKKLYEEQGDDEGVDRANGLLSDVKRCLTHPHPSLALAQPLECNFKLNFKLSLGW